MPRKTTTAAKIFQALLTPVKSKPYVRQSAAAKRATRAMLKHVIDVIAGGCERELLEDYCGTTDYQAARKTELVADAATLFEQTYYIVEPQREAHAEKLMAELRGCGILCRSCHRQYDAHERYGHPKVAWDAKFKAGGVAAANWEQWKREYLCLSQDLQMMIEEAEA